MYTIIFLRYPSTNKKKSCIKLCYVSMFTGRWSVCLYCYRTKCKSSEFIWLGGLDVFIEVFSFYEKTVMQWKELDLTIFNTVTTCWCYVSSLQCHTLANLYLANCSTICICSSQRNIAKQEAYLLIYVIKLILAFLIVHFLNILYDYFDYEIVIKIILT